jgi:hypothetical protein
MSIFRFLTIGLLCLLFSLPALCAEDSFPIDKALVPAKQAADVKVWRDTSSSDKRIVLRAKTSEPVYLVGIYKTHEGNVSVILPNESMPVVKLEPGKEYVFFGKGDPVSLEAVGNTKEGSLVFYAAGAPFELAPLKFGDNGPWLQIPATDAKSLGILKEKLTAMAQSDNFNRVELKLKTDKLKLMGVTPKGEKRSPDTGRDQPEQVLGVQGVTDKPVSEK